MTIAKYATKGIDHLFNAKLRCVKKYGNNPDLRQDWMDDWIEMIEENKSPNKRRNKSNKVSFDV